MSVDITIQETVNEVDITVNQNVITVNVTRTTGSGGVTSVNGDTGDVVLTTDNVAEGSTNLYFTVARVRATILTGISFVSGSVITATDTVLSALGKLQKQISSIDLPYVLKIGDRIYQEAIPQSGTTYTFEIDDRWKDSTMQSGGAVTDIILDDDAFLFPNNSVIMFRVYDVDAVLNYTAGTDLRYLGASASADIPIEVGDDCRLKKTDGIWELVISNKSTGGGSGTVTNVSGTTNEITVSSPTTTPVIGISSTYTSARDAYADAKVADTINNGTTTIAPSQNAVFDALDFTRRLITKGTGSVTGTVSETILTTLTIPANTLDSSCFIWTTMDFFKTSAGAVTARLYVNNANTLTGATLLGYSILGSNRNVSFNRKFLVTGTSLDLLTANTALAQVSNEFIEALFVASTVLTINPSADIFLIYTTQNDATGTVATNKMATVQKMKL